MGVAAGVSLGLSAVSAKKQKDAGKAADRLAGQDADRIRKETEKTVERTGKAQEQTLSLAGASQGASGLRSGAGTTADYLDEMQQTFQDDLDWITESGASQESLRRAEGSLAKQQSSAAAWGTVASGVSSFGSYWGGK